MAICPTCGAKNPDNAQVCGLCGKSLSQSQVAPAAPVYSQQTQAYPQQAQGYPQQDQGYPQQAQAYPQQAQAYPQQAQAYPQQAQAYPQQDQAYPQQDQAYPQQDQAYAGDAYQNPAPPVYAGAQDQALDNRISSSKDKGIAILLVIFLGIMGIHRFYVGKTGTGILMLITAGGAGIWAIIDFVNIISNQFTDSNGFVLDS